MNYKLVLFKADEAPELAAEFSRNHAAVLAGYGCTEITSHKDRWSENPAAYAIVAYDAEGTMVSGIRLHMYHQDFPLPVQSAIVELDPRIENIVRQEAPHITGEACALWTSACISGKGFGLIMTQAAIAVATRLGASTLFGFASPFTYSMFRTLGYTRVPSVGRNGDFLYPTADYISTVILISDLAQLSHASPENRERMLSIRNAPVQLTNDRAQNMMIEYSLNKCIVRAPKLKEQVLV